MKDCLIIILIFISSVSLSQTDNSNLINNVPKFLLKGKREFEITENPIDFKKKKSYYTDFCKSNDLFLRLDSSYQIQTDSIINDLKLIDFNYDGRKDILFYKMLPFCNFQPYIILALKNDKSYNTIFQGEGDIVSFVNRNDSATMQIFIQGCCGDQYGYLYTYNWTKTERLISIIPTVDIFWFWNSKHPEILNENIDYIVSQDSLTLKPIFNDKQNNNRIKCPEHYCFRGDKGNILLTYIENQEKWYYLRVKTILKDKIMHNVLSNINEVNIYGWIKFD